MAKYCLQLDVAHESPDIKFFEGPEVPDWNNFIETLIGIVVREKLSQKKLNEKFSINWMDVSFGVRDLLKERGYEETDHDFPTYCLGWDVDHLSEEEIEKFSKKQ
ncbi:MAG: hypothetical protein Q8P82_01160 [bacterium]|nr:hypothetical protein [bacterium]